MQDVSAGKHLFWNVGFSSPYRKTLCSGRGQASIIHLREQIHFHFKQGLRQKTTVQIGDAQMGASYSEKGPLCRVYMVVNSQSLTFTSYLPLCSAIIFYMNFNLWKYCLVYCLPVKPHVTFPKYFAFTLLTLHLVKSPQKVFASSKTWDTWHFWQAHWHHLLVHHSCSPLIVHTPNKSRISWSQLRNQAGSCECKY